MRTSTTFPVLLLMGLLQLALLGPAQGQVGVSIDWVSADGLVATPGGITTLVYRISNDGPETRTLNPTALLPETWALVGTLAPIDANPGVSSVAFLAIRIPAGTAAGAYSVGLLARANDTSQELRIETSLTVTRTGGIELSVPDPRAYASAGDRVTVPFRVVNSGNHRTRIRLEASSQLHTEVRLDSNSVSLAPLETRHLALSLETGDAVSNETIHHIYINAQNDDGEFASATARVHVLPRYGSTGRSGATHPINLVLSTVGDETGGQAQIGASSRFRALGGTFDFDVLAANRKSTPMFGSRDKYRMEFKSQDLTVSLGDQSRRTSPLISRGDYGAGIGLAAKRGRTRFSGFAQQSRHVYPTKQVVAASLGYVLHPRATLSVNAGHRTGTYEGEAVSARAELTPFGPSHNLDVECGFDADSSFQTPSCLVDVNGKLALGGQSPLSYRGEWIKTGVTFPGQQHDTEVRSGRVTYNLDSGIGLEGSARFHRFGGTSSFNRAQSSIQVGATVTRRRGKLRAFGGMHLLSYRWDYHAPGISVDRAQNTIRSHAGLRQRRVDLRATVDVSYSESEAYGYSGSGRRYQLSGRWSPVRSLMLSATGERSNGYLNGSVRPSQRSLTNLRVSYRAAARTTLTASVYQNTITDQDRRVYRSGRVDLRRALRGGREIRFQVQQSGLPGASTPTSTDFQLSLSLPVGVPIGSQGVAQQVLTGRVFDVETGQGLSEVLLFLESSASITGPDGQFELALPATQSAFLNIDQASIGFDSVPLVTMPYQVQREPVQPLQIPIARAALLRGNVGRYGPPGEARLLGRTDEPEVSLGGVPNVVLSLTNDGTEYRTRSNSSGSYEFRNVRPGGYHLRVVAAPRIEHYEFDSDSLFVELGGGQIGTADLRMSPSVRTIRMISQLQPDTEAPFNRELVPRDSSGNDGRGSALSLLNGSTAPVLTPRRIEIDPAGPGYTLIVASSERSALAEAEMARFTSLGHPVAVLNAPDRSGHTRYRVAVGIFPSVSAATSEARALAGRIPADTWVRRISTRPGPESTPDEGGQTPDQSPEPGTETAGTPPPFSITPPPSGSNAPASELDTGSSGYTLIVASSRSRTRAKANQALFAGLGQPTAILGTTDQGGDRYRVALGDFPTIPAANSALETLRDQLPEGTWIRRIRSVSNRSQGTSVRQVPDSRPVDPESPGFGSATSGKSTATATATDTETDTFTATGKLLDPRGPGYTLIFGSSVSRPEAEVIQQRFAGLGHPTAVLSYPDEDGGTRFRVAVGSFPTVIAATSNLEQLGDRAPKDTWVLRIRR